jgi:hypothetical protein
MVLARGLQMMFGMHEGGERRRVATALALGCVALVLSTAALAQRRPEPPRWRGDIGRFHEHDWGVWRSGRWVHGPHDGRLGWWWVIGTGVGAFWYFYPAPVYPYPSPWEPPPAVLVTPPPSPPPPPTQYWYYCEASRAYYPYVATCPGGWKAVPATPPEAPAQPK